MSLRFASLCLVGCLALTPWPRDLLAEESLLAQIQGAPEGSVIRVDKGTHKDPWKLTRSVTLQGASVDESVLLMTADEPAISITNNATVVIDSMTIRWRLATSEPQPGPATAVYVKDANLTLRNCRLIAEGNGKRCPSGLSADGFSEVTLENCRVDGFEFAANISGGAQGKVVDSLFLDPGHCGISVFSGSQVVVERTIIAQSLYHGLRSTGGKLTATDNLIINNRNRGIYLGNKSAQVDISQNVILGNGSGISGFAQTTGTIRHNVILNSEYAAIDSRDTCTISIEDNILSGNARGFVLFAESGRNRVSLKDNTFWENQTDTENCELPTSAITANPQLSDPKAGNFAAASTEVQAAGHGLADAASLAKLWKKWQAVQAEHTGD